MERPMPLVPPAKKKQSMSWVNLDFFHVKVDYWIAHL